MRVLGLCSYPIEAASTRYRLIQYISPLAEHGIDLTVSPFLNKTDFATLYQRKNTVQKASRMVSLASKRIFNSLKAKDFDLIFLQREAMLFGPPLIEWLLKYVKKKPLVLDLDDATYIKYVSPTYGRIGSALKFFGKTDTLIDWSETVICGNRFIAEYVEKQGKKAEIIPTVVDTDLFFQLEKDTNKIPVIGWIGTHSTFPFLQKLFPVFEKLATKYKFILKIVGAGDNEAGKNLNGIKIENLEWSLEREIFDFQSLDIGLYPILTTDLVNKEWLMGKSGFKAIQYMSVGIPYVVTPIGVTSEIGIENQTHFTALTEQDWYEKLAKLLESPSLRVEMGNNGRKYALENYTVSQQAQILATTLRNTVEEFNPSR